MLTITPDAMDIIRRVTEHPRLDDGAGVRIASRPDPSAPLRVHVTDHPEPGDRVLEREGARLYLAPVAAERVAGRERDAVTDAEGRVRFVSRRAA